MPDTKKELIDTVLINEPLFPGGPTDIAAPASHRVLIRVTDAITIEITSPSIPFQVP